MTELASSTAACQSPESMAARLRARVTASCSDRPPQPARSRDERTNAVICLVMAWMLICGRLTLGAEVDGQLDHPSHAPTLGPLVDLHLDEGVLHGEAVLQLGGDLEEEDAAEGTHVGVDAHAAQGLDLVIDLHMLVGLVHRAGDEDPGEDEEEADHRAEVGEGHLIGDALRVGRREPLAVLEAEMDVLAPHVEDALRAAVELEEEQHRDVT